MIYERFRARCEFCGNDLDIRVEGVHQFVRGWVKNREGGGGHGISLPERDNKWAHGDCVDRKTKGTFAQEKLFG